MQLGSSCCGVTTISTLELFQILEYSKELLAAKLSCNLEEQEFVGCS